MKRALAGLAVAVSFIVPSVEAATVTDCRDLQDALDASFAGEAVTLAEGLVCLGSFNLPSHAIVLQGAGGGATLDGATTEGQYRILSGVDVGATIIRNLTFRNGLAPFEDGGAIHITGNSPVTLEDNRFFDNEATFAGGAVYLVNSTGGPAFTFAPAATAPGIVVRENLFGGPGDANVGHDGGALYAFSDSAVELSGNQFRENRAFSRGGAASVFGCEGVALHHNTFTGNRILPLTPSFLTLRGGALYVAPACDPLPETPAHVLIQTANAFTSNVIEAGDDDASGGAEAVQGFRTLATGDRFVRNGITGAAGTERGGGLSVEAFGAEPPVFVGRNLVLAGNTFEAGGTGGGLYFGAAGGGTLTLVNATVVVNGAAAGGALAGGPAAALTLHNSIVIFNSPTPEIAGFATRDIRFTDACLSWAPLPGEGNICAVPALANIPDEVNQLWVSPTIDAGSDALVPADLTADLDGEMRRSGLAVDMGADEWHLPVCDAVTADPWLVRRKPRQFATVTLSSPVDPWGEPVTVTVTGVRQDEPVSRPQSAENLAPDAMPGEQGHEVRLRRESSVAGDGRVYLVAFQGGYSRGTCTGERTIGVPLVRRLLMDSGPPYYDSFGP